jgi:hypothetical protein
MPALYADNSSVDFNRLAHLCAGILGGRRSAHFGLRSPTAKEIPRMHDNPFMPDASIRRQSLGSFLSGLPENRAISVVDVFLDGHTPLRPLELLRRDIRRPRYLPSFSHSSRISLLARRARSIASVSPG